MIPQLFHFHASIEQDGGAIFTADIVATDEKAAREKVWERLQTGLPFMAFKRRQIKLTKEARVFTGYAST